MLTFSEEIIKSMENGDENELPIVAVSSSSSDITAIAKKNEDKFEVTVENIPDDDYNYFSLYIEKNSVKAVSNENKSGPIVDVYSDTIIYDTRQENVPQAQAPSATQTSVFSALWDTPLGERIIPDEILTYAAWIQPTVKDVIELDKAITIEGVDPDKVGFSNNNNRIIVGQMLVDKDTKFVKLSEKVIEEEEYSVSLSKTAPAIEILTTELTVTSTGYLGLHQNDLSAATSAENSTPSAGNIYWNTSENIFRYWHKVSSTWVDAEHDDKISIGADTYYIGYNNTSSRYWQNMLDITPDNLGQINRDYLDTKQKYIVYTQDDNSHIVSSKGPYQNDIYFNTNEKKFYRFLKIEGNLNTWNKHMLNLPLYDKDLTGLSTTETERGFNKPSHII